MTTDVWRVDVPQPARIRLRGQDLVTELDGRTRVLDQLAIDLTLDEVTGEVLHAEHPDLAPLVGANVRRGWGKAVAAVFAAEQAQRTLRWSILEDLGAACLVSGFTHLLDGRLHELIRQAHHAAGGSNLRRVDAQSDICVGWRVEGPVHAVAVEFGRSAIPIGGPAPAVWAGDPAGWHAVPDMPPGTLRRMRRLDTWPTDDGWALDSHFRDSAAIDGDAVRPEQMVLHEYALAASVDNADRLASVTVEHMSLPWAGCPGAVPSAQLAVGTPLADLPARARTELIGRDTCTHLSSTLRELADVVALRPNLPVNPAP
ncbi:DUF2889 domain-containing protein [Gordonia sp. (in: high G+C Gram-positive bacteria)]|uniref:DUF2889 domain-containing protein n=1 Tax=Gordonia sp. (in: high G+C Gram-positive bacteria) TaxID=84139 RepID=UPI0016B0F92D|nr:DUF2889 domain-containing protein [Gordonia sp. (in: high G+C Gram-positive bacteria)]NLG45385.1 DUF2889 domain-containing protein [Gordonia sp. (in: high G+C Gram-positive bacteria)]